MFGKRRRKQYTRAMQLVCGIDFGTSNSTVGVVQNGTFSMVPLEGDHTTIPSAIFYPADKSPPLYGRNAIAVYSEREPGRLLRSLKSVLGSSLINEKTPLGGRMLPLEDVLVGFVDHLKAKAEGVTGKPISRVVMGRPIHFVDNNPDADRDAENKLREIALKAGFEDVLFQFEPIAAARQYESTISQNELALIADIGGGTSDFSIIRVGPDHRDKADRSKDILANEGVRVGGTNFDTRLSMKSVMPLLGSNAKTSTGLDMPKWPFLDLATWHRIHMLNAREAAASLKQTMMAMDDKDLAARYLKVVNEQIGHLMAAHVEDAKIALSDAENTLIDLDMVEPKLTAKAARRSFETASRDELRKIENSVAKAIKTAGITPKDITAVFLTGGSTAIPSVRQAIVEQFPKIKVIQGDRFNSVGYGLSLDAAQRF